MYKQLKLNLKTSRWIIYLGIFTIIFNLIMSLINQIGEVSTVMIFVNLLNLFSMALTLTFVHNTHNKFANNSTFELYHTLPIHKADILKGDYATHIVMMLFTAVIFLSYTLVIQRFEVIFSLIILVGVSLLMMSVYQWMFTRQWYKSLSLKTIIHSVPLFLVLMFHFMPVFNMGEYNWSYNQGWIIFLFYLPVGVLIFGSVIYGLTFLRLRKIILKTDIN